MPGERVEIIYEATVRGGEKIQDLSRKTAELQDANDKVTKATEGAARAQDKQKDALLRARDAIKAFRREIFAITFAIGLIKGLSSASDELAERFEKLGRATSKMLQPLGNAIARFFGGKGELSDTKKAELLSMQEDIARLRGDNAEALRKKLEGEEIKFTNSIQSLSEDKKRIFREEFEERKKLLIEQQRLEELGLKRQREIFNDFKKDLVTGFRGETGNVLFNLFEGNSQSGGDILKGFRTAISRALSDALSQSLFTSVLGGGGLSGFFDNFKSILTGKNSTTSAVKAVEDRMKEANSILAQARDCICITAENTAIIAANSHAMPGQMTITPPKKGALDKIGAISGAVASVGMLFAGAGGGGAAPPVDAGLPPGANITMGGGPLMHTGGFVRAYSSGGEVPITAQGGEFVVRKSVAMMNKDFLTDFNMHGDSKRSKNAGGGNVFIIKANDAASFDRQLGTPSGRQQIEVQVIRAIMGNGNIRKVIQNFTR